jgi:hypothetical protein
VIFLIFSCSGLNDWKYNLPNGYVMVHINSRRILIGLENPDSTSFSLYENSRIDGELIGIPPNIVEFCYNSQYVFAKTMLPDNIESSKIENYYFLDTANKNVIGPISNIMDCFVLFFDLSLKEKFSDWYSTKSPKHMKGRLVDFDQNSVVPSPFLSINLRE